MNLSSITIKNVKYNLKKYGVFLFAISIIQCILFMFFNVLFSSELKNSDDFDAISQNLYSVMSLMAAFCMVFIIYTTVSFTKTRGKEFGVYFTIGLTAKEIIRILSIENILISISSFFIGSITGSIFSRLFNMAICKMINLQGINISLNIEAYVIVLLVSAAIFLYNTLYQLFFIKRYSIINILKSKSKKDIGKTSVFAGAFGIIVLLASLIIFNESLKGSFNDTNMMLVLSLIGTFISVYLVIGFSMTAIVEILKRFKYFYNNNILFLNSLTHKFKNYRSVLFVVTLMVAGAMFFIALGYSMYKSVGDECDSYCPYDLSFISKNNNYKELLEDKVGKLADYKEMEAINVPDIYIKNENCDAVNNNIAIISEETYKRLTNDDLNIENGELTYISRNENKYEDFGFLIDLNNDYENFKNQSIENYKESHSKEEYFCYDEEKVSRLSKVVINYMHNDYYSRYSMLVVNNEDYKEMKSRVDESEITYDILVNLSSKDDYKNIASNFSNLLDDKEKDSLLIKEDMFNSNIQSRGFTLFLFSFLGGMFLIGSGAVLYFKIITSMDEDRERSIQLNKFGLNEKEISSLCKKEIASVFLVPPLIAVILVGYFLNSIMSSINYGEQMFKNTLVVFAVYCVIQFIFYLLTSRKYLKKILKA